MPRIYKISRAGLKLIYKIRHHRGHGIHSPFVFNLVTKVIEEKTPYHAYEDIIQVLEEFPDYQFHLNKTNKLLFKMVNYFGAKHILEIGAGYGINTLCLTAPSAKIECITMEASEKKYSMAQQLYKKWQRDITLITSPGLPDVDGKQDCIFIDLNNYNTFSSRELNQYLAGVSYEKTFVIVKGIRTNKRHQALWRGMMNMESRTVALDLFNIGILFFDKTLYRWHYKISF